MRVADYIFQTLADRGTKHVFLVTGGGAMHLNDALRREKRLIPVCNHHEQACAIAAEGYVRAGGEKPAVVSVTTGPGGTNALTGVIGQWLDSIPVLYLSGQVKFETTIRSCPELGLRQLGDQEINIVDIVRPVTKYAAMVTEPEAIREELEKALYYAQEGRPGPVWLDIPLNVQGALIDPAGLRAFAPPPAAPAPAWNPEELWTLLRQAKRPAIIAGAGIRIAGAEKAFLQLAEQLQIPLLSTFNGVGILPTDHPLYAGRIGTQGQRAGNFILQNADLVLSIGSRNNIRQVSYNWQSTCRAAVKISVDIDPAELKKKLFRPDLAIQRDAGKFIAEFTAYLLPRRSGKPDWSEWLAWCRERRRRYPAHTAEHRAWKQLVNPYHFMHELTSRASADWNIVAGNGTACVALFQTGIVKEGRPMFWNSGCASMGYDLPAAIGACLGNGRPTICLAGDGSFMMNLQELQTVVHRQLPIKIFLLDNNGYGSIKQTQSNFFGNELIGCDGPSGVSFPDFRRVAAAFGIPDCEIADQTELTEKIDAVLSMPGPVLCVVRMPDHLPFAPKLSSKKLPDGRMISKPLEDLYPFLDREEFRSNMIIEPELEE
mgnify:FL=1